MQISFVWFLLVCSFFCSPVDSQNDESMATRKTQSENQITAAEQKDALLSLRQALGDPVQLAGWMGPGPCIRGQPVWIGITACSRDDLVQAM